MIVAVLVLCLIIDSHVADVETSPGPEIIGEHHNYAPMHSIRDTSGKGQDAANSAIAQKAGESSQPDQPALNIMHHLLVDNCNRRRRAM